MPSRRPTNDTICFQGHESGGWLEAYSSNFEPKFMPQLTQNANGTEANFTVRQKSASSRSDTPGAYPQSPRSKEADTDGAVPAEVNPLPPAPVNPHHFYIL